MPSFLSNINLSGNEVQNFVVQPLATAPSDLLKLGRKYFDTASKREQIYSGSKWLSTAYMDDVSAVSETLGALRTEFDALYKTLNEDDAQGKIDTWSEIVDFLNDLEASGGDLATLLSSIGGDIDTLEGYFTKGVANEAAKVSNSLTVKFNGSSYVFNGSADKEIDFSAANIVSALGTTPVNRATADASGNNITDTYTTKAAFEPVFNWYDSLKDYVVSEGGNVRIKTNLIVEG